ncbi:MAG: hypothetical protein K6L73_01940 [Cellvibrionaceae bacterium]
MMPAATDDFPLLPGTLARIKPALHHPQSNAISVARAIQNDPGFCWKLFYRAHRRAPGKVQYVSRLPHLIGLLGLPYTEQLLQGSHELNSKGVEKKYSREQQEKFELLYQAGTLAARLSLSIAPKNSEKLFFPTLFYLQPLWRVLSQTGTNDTNFTLQPDLASALSSAGKSIGPFAAELNKAHGEQPDYFADIHKLSALPQHLLLDYFDDNPQSSAFWLSDSGTIALCINIAWSVLFHGPNDPRLHQQLQLAALLWQSKFGDLFSKLSTTIVTHTQETFSSAPSHKKPKLSLAAYWLAGSNCNSLISSLPPGQERELATNQLQETLQEEWQVHLQALKTNSVRKLNDVFQNLAEGIQKISVSRCAIMLVDNKQQQLRSVTWRGDTPGDGLRKLSLSLPDEVHVSALKTLLNKPGLFLLNQKNRKQIQPKLPQRLGQLLSGDTLFHSLHYKGKPLALAVCIGEPSTEGGINIQQQKNFQKLINASQSALDRL